MTTTANDLTENEFRAWYGPWEPLSLNEIAKLLRGSGVRWWVAGGVAIDAACGVVTRQHDDVDVAVATDDLPALRRRLRDWHLWEAHLGSLTPLLSGNELSPGREQLWLRRDASGPWRLDILLSPMDGPEWVFKRDHAIRLPVSQALVTWDGVSYLAPQAVLLHKARLMRDKDQRDFDVVLPHLDTVARAWLSEALRRHLPGHPWLARLH